MTWWSPKPLRSVSHTNSLFQMVEPETTVKGLSPIERQRKEDGTPMTRTPPSALRPADPALSLKSDLINKGSMVARYDEKYPRNDAPRLDPPEPLGVLKSYLAYKAQDCSSEEEIEKAKEHENPEGGLSAAGRKHFNKTEGSNLKPGVTKAEDDMSDAEKRRKGSFLTRHYKGEHNASKPLKDEKGEPTRHALQAKAWGEPAPKDHGDRAKLVDKGERLLAEAKEKVSKAQDLLKAELTAEKRGKLKKPSFAIPEDRKYPIHDEAHARNALARVAQHGTPEEQRRVREAVKKKHEGIEVTEPKKDDDEVEKGGVDKLFASVARFSKSLDGAMAKAARRVNSTDDSE